MGTSSDAADNRGSSAGNVYPDAPRVAVGAVVFHRGRVLLVKRATPPAEGQWAIPGGSVGLGETLRNAAEREVFEETGLLVRAKEPVFTFEVIDRDAQGRIRFHYLIVDLEAEYLEGDLKAGDDAADARWVSAEEFDGLPINESSRRLLSRHYGFGTGRQSPFRKNGAQ
ncbi:MAG: NUDIX hydrolase [Desulfobacterales bacterium]|jgi:ADP-ribose pyrophosphatase